MLAAFHRRQPDFRPHRRNAGGIDHHIDQPGIQQGMHIGGQRDLARLHRGIGGIGGGYLGDIHLIAIGNLDRPPRCAGLQLTDRADGYSGHVGDAADDIGPHLSRADKTDSDRFATIGACGKIAGQASQGDIGGHWASPDAFLIELLEHLLICQSGVQAALQHLQ